MDLVSSFPPSIESFPADEFKLEWFHHGEFDGSPSSDVDSTLLNDFELSGFSDTAPVKEELTYTLDYTLDDKPQLLQKLPSISPDPEQVASEAIRSNKRVKLEKSASRAPAKVHASSPSPESSVSPPAEAGNDTGIRPGSFFDILTEDERQLMEAEGIEVPLPGPLCKLKERELKRLRRQVKNKHSAKDSRRKRKEYVETLEAKNSDIDAQLREMQAENKSLHKQLSAMRMSLQRSGSKVDKSAPATGTCGSSTTSAALLLICLLVSSTTSKPQSAKMNAGLRDFLHARVPTKGTPAFADGVVKGVDGSDATEAGDEDDKDAAAVLDSAMLSDDQSKQVLSAASKAVQDVLRKITPPQMGGATVASKSRSSTPLKRKADVLGAASGLGAHVASY
eukprot:m.277694 g.277694  ORF g.277694 m.277694 type:complete len:394 (-) comp19786_c0_seq3:364-1545(-)